jgi:hypothetical protein
MASTARREILAATTSAANSSGFNVTKDQPQSVFVNGLAGVETAALQHTLDDGETFTASTDAAGAVELTASRNTLQVTGPGEYRIAKSATVGSVAVFIVG